MRKKIYILRIPVFGLTVFALLFLSLLSCSTKEPGFQEIERITGMDEAEAAIEHTATQFVVPPQQELDFWNRARTFFASQLGNEGIAFSHVGSDGIRVSNAENKKAKYIYSVEKVREKSGNFQFTVNCREGDDGVTEKSAWNARILAYFIQTGQVETLLIRE